MPAGWMESRILRRPGLSVAWLAICVPLGFGLLSLLVRQDYNWDLLNYHYYNPYAWLHGRRGVDIDAAMMPGGHLNPLLHLPLYLAIGVLPPRLIGFLIGAAQGTNAILLFAIARSVLPPMPPERRDLAAMVLGLLGTLAAGNLGEIGTMFGDNLLSLPVLAALLMLVAHAEPLAQATGPGALAVAAGSGVLLGLAAGLKPTMWVYGVGLGLACMTLPASPGRRVAVSCTMSLGAMAGCAVTGGFWMVELWQRYANPIFPFFNDWFRSPWAAADPHLSPRYLPKSWTEAATLAFRYPADSRLVGEIRFVELRVPLLYALGLLASAATAWRVATGRLAGMARHDAGRSAMVLAWLAGSYLAWASMFAIYRYLIALEMLAPLGAILLLDRLGFAGRWLVGAATALMIGTLAFMRVGGWGHVPWSSHHFSVEPPELTDAAHTVVVLPGVEPVAFVAPFFPPEVRFIRISRWDLDSPAAPTGMERMAYEAVTGHSGPSFALFRASERAVAAKALGRLGLALATDGCRPLVVRAEQHKPDGLVFCGIERIEEPSAADSQKGGRPVP